MAFFSAVWRTVFWFGMSNLKDKRQKGTWEIKKKREKLLMQFMIQAQHSWSKLEWHSDPGDMVRQMSESKSKVFRDAMETSGLQNSSHPQQSFICFLLAWEFTPTCGILQEKEGFQGLLKVRNYYNLLPLQSRIVTWKQNQWAVWNRLPDQRREQGHLWQCQPHLMHWEVTQGKGMDRGKSRNSITALRFKWETPLMTSTGNSLGSSKGRNEIRMTQMLYSHQKHLPSPTCTPAVTGQTTKKT